MFGGLLVELLLLGLHQTLDLALEFPVELAESLLESGDLVVLGLFFLLVLLPRGATQRPALPSLESDSLLFHTDLESLLDALSPGARIGPNAMVDQVIRHRLLPAVVLEIQVLGRVQDGAHEPIISTLFMNEKSQYEADDVCDKFEALKVFDLLRMGDLVEDFGHHDPHARIVHHLDQLALLFDLNNLRFMDHFLHLFLENLGVIQLVFCAVQDLENVVFI